MTRAGPGDVVELLSLYLAEEGREAKEEAAMVVAGACRQAGLDVWFWYDPRGDDPLQAVIDLPGFAITLPVPVLHDRPEGVRTDWPARLPEIGRLMAERRGG